MLITPKIETVENAMVYPATLPTNRAIIDAGVRDNNGAIVESALHWRGYQYNHPKSSPTPTRCVDEPVIYGGFHFFPNFNHTIAESLGRLWALKNISSASSRIVFLAGAPNSTQQDIPNFFKDLLSALDIKHDVSIVSEPTEFKKLIVPSQLYGVSIPPHEELVSFFRERLSRKVPERKLTRSIFVSRSNWPLFKGGIVCEGDLVEHLAQNGFEIIFPENLSIAEQLAAYSQSRRLIFSEGSAAHLFALVQNPEQEVSVIQRRKGFPVHLLGIWNVKSVDAIVHMKFLRKHPHPNANAACILDFRRVQRILNETGLIYTQNPWRNPSLMILNAELSAAGFDEFPWYRYLELRLPGFLFRGIRKSIRIARKVVNYVRLRREP